MFRDSANVNCIQSGIIIIDIVHFLTYFLGVTITIRV